MTFESHPKSTSMHEPNYEQSEKYSIANDDYTVFSVIPLGLRDAPLRTTRFAPCRFFIHDLISFPVNPIVSWARGVVRLSARAVSDALNLPRGALRVEVKKMGFSLP